MATLNSRDDEQGKEREKREDEGMRSFLQVEGYGLENKDPHGHFLCADSRGETKRTASLRGKLSRKGFHIFNIMSQQPLQ